MDPTSGDAVLAPSTVLVYDLGGGTLDVTVLRIDGKELTVIATEGEVRLGGTDWDERIVNYASERFVEKFNLDPRHDPQSLQDLSLLAEDAKKDLSRRQSVQFAVNHAGLRLPVTLTRDQFNEMTSDLLFRSQSRVERVVIQAKLAWKDIDEVLLVGGSTRMPQVRQMLGQVTGKEPNGSLSADEVVAHGAAIHAAMALASGRVKKGSAPSEVHPPAPPSEAAQAARAAAPAAAELESPLLALQRTVAGAEADVLPAGAAEADLPSPGVLAEYAAQAAGRLLTPSRTDSPEAVPDFLRVFDQDVVQTLQDVTTHNVNAHSLGVVACHPRSGREVNSIMVPRNTILPASGRRVFGTVQTNQRVVKIPSCLR